ncbi:MAG: MBL fold metallo-hydrolase [Victivallales bacterium]|nr:MBL fold metallo-hydrolase [Victivallales bacterium]
MTHKFDTVVVGFLEVNCYIVPSAADKCVYIIDPGASPGKIADAAKKIACDDYRILLTHGHIDHIGGVAELHSLLPVTSVFMHQDDTNLYNSPANELPPLMPALKNPVQPRNDFESRDIRLIHTPGHTRGCVCYYLEHSKILFSGDTLFFESVGRTDLPGGSSKELISSIRGKLLSLPDDVDVFPGHGPATSIAHEKKTNPFI